MARDMHYITENNTNVSKMTTQYLLITGMFTVSFGRQPNRMITIFQEDLIYVLSQLI